MLMLQGVTAAKRLVLDSPYFRTPKTIAEGKSTFSPTVVGWLVNKNVQTIPVVRMAVDFFALLYLKDCVAKRGGSCSEGWDTQRNRPTLFYANPVINTWYQDVLDLFEETTSFLDEFMLTYLCAATAGELRHAPGKAAGQADFLPLLNKWRICVNSQVTDRTTTQRQFLLGMGAPQVVDYLRDADTVFRKYKWGGSFGGKKWADIAKTGLDRMINVYDPIVFVDRVFDLKHNGGPMFDKNSVIEQSSLPQFLDAKLHIKKDQDWDNWIHRGTKRVVALVQQAHELKLWQTSKPILVSSSLPESLIPGLKNVANVKSEKNSPLEDALFGSTPAQNNGPDFPNPFIPCPTGVHKK